MYIYMYIYIFIYIYIYIYKQYFNIVSPTTYCDTSASPSGSLNFYFAKVTKIIKVTYSIKSVK